jgi:hypothetical protein
MMGAAAESIGALCDSNVISLLTNSYTKAISTSPSLTAAAFAAERFDHGSDDRNNAATAEYSRSIAPTAPAPATHTQVSLKTDASATSTNSSPYTVSGRSNPFACLVNFLALLEALSPNPYGSSSTSKPKERIALAMSEP